jgi:hypothetical protein
MYMLPVLIYMHTGYSVYIEEYLKTYIYTSSEVL